MILYRLAAKIPGEIFDDLLLRQVRHFNKRTSFNVIDDG